MRVYVPYPKTWETASQNVEYDTRSVNMPPHVLVGMVSPLTHQVSTWYHMFVPLDTLSVHLVRLWTQQAQRHPKMKHPVFSCRCNKTAPSYESALFLFFPCLFRSGGFLVDFLFSVEELEPSSLISSSIPCGSESQVSNGMSKTNTTR